MGLRDISVYIERHCKEFSVCIRRDRVRNKVL